MHRPTGSAARSFLLFLTPALVCGAELQHFWSFESAGAPLADPVSGVGGTLTEPATASFVEGRAPGTRALHTASTIAGASDYVLLPGTSPAMFSPGTKAFSIHLWFRMATDAAVNRGIADFSGNGGDGWHLLLTAANSLNFRVDGSGTYNLVAAIPGAVVEDNAWHFFAAVYDPALTTGTLKVYLDGSAVSASADRGATAATAVQLNANCWLGTFNFANISEAKGLDGDLDELACYSGTLTGTQIAGLRDGTILPQEIASPLPEVTLAINPLTGIVNLSWPSQAENYYTVWSTGDLVTWTRLASTPLQGSGSILNFQTAGGTARGFFRVRRY